VIASYFGLRHLPFTQELPTCYFYASPPFKEALARLHYLVDTRGLGLLTGEIGAGKSACLRALADQLDPARHPVLYFADSGLEPAGFYRDVLQRCGVEPSRARAEVRRQFQTLFLDWYRHQDKTALLCFDEAHLLSPAMIQEVRYLTNFGIDAGTPFACVLVGQPELRSLLRLKSLEAVTQRITVRFHLAGLDADQTAAYLHHQMTAAGASRPVFSDAAVHALHTYTRGLPRLLNNFATACLWDVAAHNHQTVEEEHVQRVLAEFQQA
jgi:type II secretory pathway predicted ATPase ExeA